MTTASFTLSAWSPDQTAALEAWGHDRRSALQAGLEGALALMRGDDAPPAAVHGPVAPLRGEGDSLATLFDDLLDDLMEQVAVHGPVQLAALDGVLQRSQGGFVAWGYLSPQEHPASGAACERAGNAVAAETPAETRLRVTLRRLA